MESDDELGPRLAATVRRAREELRLSPQQLADAAGISRTMLTRIEKAGASPTAALLAKLSGALGLSLSELIARSERSEERLVRAADQQLWTDPGTGYLRRSVSPPVAHDLQLVEVVLPPGALVPSPAAAYAARTQQLWVLEGELVFTEGEVDHVLGPGDCLQLGAPADCAFANRSAHPTRYLVALARRSPRA